MGYAPYYQAIPEQSELFRQLRTDAPLARLLSAFFTLGSRPFDLLETGQEEVKDVICCQTVYRSQEEAEAAFGCLLSEIERANRLSPGWIERSCYIEKTQYEIEERLVQELQRRGHSEPRSLAETCIRGELAFGGEFRLVPAQIVALAASLVREIEPEMLFDMVNVGADSLYDDYRHWRGMYLQAADRGEAILIF